MCWYHDPDRLVLSATAQVLMLHMGVSNSPVMCRLDTTSPTPLRAPAEGADWQVGLWTLKAAKSTSCCLCAAAEACGTGGHRGRLPDPTCEEAWTTLQGTCLASQVQCSCYLQLSCHLTRVMFCSWCSSCTPAASAPCTACPVVPTWVAWSPCLLEPCCCLGLPALCCLPGSTVPFPKGHTGLLQLRLSSTCCGRISAGDR